MKKTGIGFLISLCLFNILPPIANAEPRHKEESNKNSVIYNLSNIDHLIDNALRQIASVVESKNWERIAVVEIKSLGDSSDPQVENYLFEQLTLKTGQLKGITIVEKKLLAQALADLDAEFIDLANLDRLEKKILLRRGLLQKMGELTHADGLLSGTITASGGKATIVIGMIDVESSETYRIAEENSYQIAIEPAKKTIKTQNVQSLHLPKQRFYFGFGSTYTTIRGDFNGQAVVSGPNDKNVVPEINDASGLGAFVGYRFDSEWALEASSWTSSHQAKWSGNSMNVHYKQIGYDLKYNFIINSSRHPYLLIGVGLHEIAIENDKLLKAGDATYGGVGFNVGMGLEHTSSPQISVGARITYHSVDYDKDTGGDSGPLQTPINGNGFGVLLAATYYF